MTTDDMDDVAAEVSHAFTDLLEQHGYFTVVAGAALALAGLALDIPPDADLTDKERDALEKLFDEVSAPLKSVIKVRMKDKGMDGFVAAN